MKKVIAELLVIVKNAKNEKAAAQSISHVLKKVSPTSALNIVRDVQDFIDEKITETELSLFLKQSGF